MDLKSRIREIEDFPEPGISFKDITTLLKDGPAMRETVVRMREHFAPKKPELVIGVESRGFLIGAPLAYDMGLGFVLIRKPGKLPAEVISVEYELEYGKDKLEIHKDSLSEGQRVLLVDDLLATGGTIKAAGELVQKLGAEIVGFSFLIELTELNGRKKLKERFEDPEILSLVTY